MLLQNCTMTELRLILAQFTSIDRETGYIITFVAHFTTKATQGSCGLSVHDITRGMKTQ